METYGYIYITTNTINKKRYIGQHKLKDWDSNYIGSGKLLKQAIKKYGIENFTCFPLAWAWNKEELNQLEIDYIAHYKPEYNIAKGGQGGDLGEEINKAKKGEKNHFFGKKHSEETRKKMRENHADFSGKKHPLFGKHLSKETREKISKSVRGFTHTEEALKKISDASKLYWQNKKQKSV